MDSRPCPCGSGDAYDACCGPFLSGAALPPTPERLMRSRYTAFALGDAAYVAATWHPGTAPDDLELDEHLVWTGLEVVEAPPVVDGARRGTVEFRAHWRTGADGGTLHERSRFVRQSDRWWYLDGVLDPPRG